MTNTYRKNEKFEIKLLEELRLIRCCLERLILRFADYQDYQFEKFYPNKKEKTK